MVNAVSINDEYGKKYNGYNYSFTSHLSSDESIFLEEKLESIQDEQGILGKAWNGIKEITSLGVSQSDCEDMLRKYRIGEVSFEEAINYLEEYDSKQETMSSLLSNIITGIGAIAIATPFGAATATGAKAIGWGLAFAKGAPIGAAIKAGLGILDRSTNEVEDDALDGKQIIKDGISGALTGAASAVSGSQCFIYKGLENASLVPANKLANKMLQGALCGVECGAMSGSASYMTDVAFGEKEFSFGDLATNTLTSAAVSGTVGATVGAGMYGLDKANLCQTSSLTGQIVKDSSSSSARKVGGTKLRQFGKLFTKS